jgi:hypothetical protein
MEENNILEPKLVSNDETNSNEANVIVTILTAIGVAAIAAGTVAVVKKVRRRKAATSSKLTDPQI